MDDRQVRHDPKKQALFGRSQRSVELEDISERNNQAKNGLQRNHSLNSSRPININAIDHNFKRTIEMTAVKDVYHLDNKKRISTGENDVAEDEFPLMAYVFDEDEEGFLSTVKEEEIEEEASLLAENIEKADGIISDAEQIEPATSAVNNNVIEEMDQAADAVVAQMFNEPIRQRVQFASPTAEPLLPPENSPTMKDEVMVDEVPPEEFKLHLVAQQEENYLAPELNDIEQLTEEAKKTEYKMEYVWVNVGIQIALHMGAIYGLYLAFTDAKWQTNLWMIAMTLYAGNSITAGAHRMWCHKAYKANFGVRLFYMIGTTMSIQNDVIEWARDHRVHHKWADSDADPHNINRGFFFAHMGWLMVKKHPKVKEMGKKVDMSDLEADPLLAFQRRHYVPLIFFSLYFLSAVPVYCWGESWNTAYFVGAILRLALQLHGTWFINSAAHTFGYKPFDTKVTAVDTFFYACLTNGEAWHNYHHTFPQDYRASEYMWKGNMSAAMIDFFAYMGWVWDRKTMSKEAIERQKLKGDHSRPLTAAHTDEDDFQCIKKVLPLIN